MRTTNRAVIALLILVSLGAGSCAGSGGEGSAVDNSDSNEGSDYDTGASGSSTTGKGSKKSQPKSEGDGKSRQVDSRHGGFSGALAGTYDTSKDVCGAFSPAKVAKDLGISSRNPVDVAQAYAETLYQPEHQQAAFEGCLAGFGL
jgi:hypothetical protein